MAKKPQFGPDLGLLGQIWAKIFFFRNLASSVTKYHDQLSSRAISEKTNYPILRKLGRQTDKSDFIGRFPTQVEQPTTP